MIGLDKEHTTDPDYPVLYTEGSKLDPDAPIWCEWVWVEPEATYGQGNQYMDSVPPYGQTVAQLKATGADTSTEMTEEELYGGPLIDLEDEEEV